MEKSFLKNGTTEIIRNIDTSTGEIINETVNHNKYLANSVEEFFLMYSSMVLILKGSSDVRMKLFAALLERYAKGQEFSIPKSLKEILAKEVGCSARSFDSAVTSLVEDNIIIRTDRSLYRVNPRHVFQGSSSERNNQLKAVLELYCKDC